jgi:anthranilate 1,2-dioxygenase (deaminating, decarboxylating) large subunit
MVRTAKPYLGMDASQVIDRRVYYAEDVYQTELERVFYRTWQFVAHEDELKKPGDFMCVTVGEQPVIVWRDRKLGLKAFYNSCAHRGAVLTGRRRGSAGIAVSCIYHGWTYGLDGKLIGVPYPDAYDETEFNRRDYGLTPIRVDSFAGLVFISLDDDIEPLEDYLNEVAPELTRVCADTEVLGRLRWTFDANWKTWAENFRDGYHPGLLHPQVRAGYKGVESSGTITHLAEGHSLLSWPMEGNRENVLKEFQDKSQLAMDPAAINLRNRPPLPVDLSQNMSVVAVFPNLDLQHFAGGSMVILEALRPLGVGKTLVDLLALAPAGEPPEFRQWRLDMSLDSQGPSGKISADDNEAVERVMRGVVAKGIPHSPMSRALRRGAVGQKYDEHAIRGFYATWRRYMGEDAI